MNTVCLCATVSHLKAALLDVVKLQAKRLYAAYDSPLVTNQTDSSAPDVTGGEKKISSVLNSICEQICNDSTSLYVG